MGHEEIAAEPYVDAQIAAEPYVHEEIAAEQYVDVQIPAEAYVHQEPIAVAAPVAVAAPAPIVNYAHATYAAAPAAFTGYNYGYAPWPIPRLSPPPLLPPKLAKPETSRHAQDNNLHSE